MCPLGSSLMYIIMGELIFFHLDWAVELSTCCKTTVFLTIFWCNELTLFIPHVYHNDTEFILLLLNLTVNWACVEKLICFFCSYTPALFYLISWCSELTWLILHVYHNCRTHSFSFEFSSGTEYMLQNLWYFFSNIYISTVF